MSHTEQMREALRMVDRAVYIDDNGKPCLNSTFDDEMLQAALTAPAAEAPEAMGDEPELPEATYSVFGLPLGYTADQLRTYAKQYAQWQSTRLRAAAVGCPECRAAWPAGTNECPKCGDDLRAAAVPEGWRITRKDDGRIVLKAPNGDAWAWANEHSTGTSNDFVYSLLDAMLQAAPPAPEDGREVVRDAERYRVLRCYELRGSWPEELGKAPAGLLAFSSLTTDDLDRVLDDMRGYLPSAAPNVRADYQAWRRATTQERIDAALSAAQAGNGGV